MPKLTASLSKKLPADGVESNSRSASTGTEVKIPCLATSEEIRCDLKQLHAVLQFAVGEQLGDPTLISDEGANRRSEAVVKLYWPYRP